MKLACTQENLNRGLSIVGRMVSRNSTLPVLGNVLLKTETGGLRLTATDLELGVSCLVGGKVEEKGEITIPARLLTDYINQLPKERVALSVEGKELQVSCETSRAQIKGISADEFPLIPKVESAFEVTIPASEFKLAIQQVAFAAAHDESRPELTGVLVNFSEKACTLASTDSFRLAEKTISCKNSAGARQVIIPSKTLIELARILEDEGNVAVRLSENQALFTYQDVELISRLLEGQYPEYKDIIPAELITRAEVAREDFINAVRAAGIFSKSGAQDVRLGLDASKKAILLKADASQVGGHTQEIPGKIEGPKDEVVFNFRYLLEGLQAIPSDQIIFETGGSSSPGKLSSSKDKNYLYILMPIKM